MPCWLPLFLFAACRSGPGTSHPVGPTTPTPTPTPTTPTAPERCAPIAPPELRDPASPMVRLTKVLHVALEGPATAELSLDGRVVARYPAAATHDLPLLGMRPDEPHEASVVFRCGATEQTLGPIAVDPGPGPVSWPEVDVLVDDPARREPGGTLLDLRSQLGWWVAVMDADGAPLWSWATTLELEDARWMPDGTVWVLGDGEIVRIDLEGRELGHWAPEALADPGETPVAGVSRFHHEVYPLEDGFLALDLQSVEVADYPLSEDDPLGPTAPATIVDTVVLDVALDGTVRGRWSLAERLDPTRIGWLSLQVDAGGFDWSHGNGVCLDPSDGNLIVSVRHQDTIVKLDRATGEVIWILSVPDGWEEPWASLRLQPVGALTWPYHAHAPELSADGRLLLFDNGNFGRTTPYTGLGTDPSFSRIVEYRIDEVARTVTQTFAREEASDGPQFSGAFGDADRLPTTDNRLGLWGYLFNEGGVRNVDRGRGTTSMRLVEAAPDGTIVWEASLWSDVADSDLGWRGHRAQRLRTLYPAAVADGG